MKICILGAGNMGTALAVAASEKKNNNIVLWSIEEEVVDEISKKHTNSKYLKKVKLAVNVKGVSDIRTALENSDYVVFSIPSNALRSVCKSCIGLVKRTAVIIHSIKGLEKNTNKRVSEVIKEYFSNEVVFIAGPSIANELALKKPTFVVFASNNIQTAKSAAKVFETSYYRISASKDLKGAELVSVFKNIIALMAGYADGLGYSANTKAGLIISGLNDLNLLVKKMGGTSDSVYGLAGAGDLIATCTSKHSRNRRYGELIGKGLSSKDSLNRINQTVEGLNSLPIAYDLIKKNKLSTSIIEKVYNIIILGRKEDV